MSASDIRSDNTSISNGMGLQSLLDEPHRLSLEAERLNVELESLVMDNYKVFVENLTCSVHLQSEDKKLGEISSALSQNLIELSQQCSSFKDRVNTFVSSHKRNRKTLQHHMQLVELLEVPQLVDACARNGFHDEALDLANFVNGLERRHLLASEVKSLHGKVRGGSGVIQSIVDDVHSTLAGLRQQLLLQLTENIALPKEIQILATLRKLDGLLIDRHLSLERYEVENVVESDGATLSTGAAVELYREQLRQHYAQCSEIRLQMDFLEARTVWLLKSSERSLQMPKVNGSNDLSLATTANKYEDSTVEFESTDVKTQTEVHNAAGNEHESLQQQQEAATSLCGPYAKVVELLEIRRTAWFAVVTQFNALFQDNTTSVSASAINKFGSGGSRGVGTALTPPQQHFSTAAILNAWTTRQVNHLLRELQQTLPLIEEGASLRSVLEQTIFFSSRMSQVGCDFSGLIVPLFQEVMLCRFRQELRQAVENFKVMLLTERISFDSKRSDSLKRDQLIPLYAAQDSATDATLSLSDNNALSDKNKSAEGINALTGCMANTELPAPQLLMRFPPLAYLLNAFLINMNYIRECPLVTVEQPALAELSYVFNDLSSYLIAHGPEVRKLGTKYFGEDFLKELTGGVGEKNALQTQPKNNIEGIRNLTNGEGAKKKSDTAVNRMDELYAQAMSLELLPHTLLCFESIFLANSTSKLEAKRKALHAKSLRPKTRPQMTVATEPDNICTVWLPCMLRNLYDAKDILECEMVERLEQLWCVLVSGKLLHPDVLVAEYGGNDTLLTSNVGLNPSTSKANSSAEEILTSSSAGVIGAPEGLSAISVDCSSHVENTDRINATDSSHAPIQPPTAPEDATDSSTAASTLNVEGD